MKPPIQHLARGLPALSLMICLAMIAFWIISSHHPMVLTLHGRLHLDAKDGTLKLFSGQWITDDDGLFRLKRNYTYLIVSDWLIVLPFLLLPAWRFLLPPRPASPGLCPSCGYDLRATPDRCPECGKRPAGKEQQNSRRF